MEEELLALQIRLSDIESKISSLKKPLSTIDINQNQLRYVPVKVNQEVLDELYDERDYVKTQIRELYGQMVGEIL